MAYAVGAHPHVRSSDSLAGRYWTAAGLLFPCVLVKVIMSWEQIFLLAVLFPLTAAVHFCFDLVNPERFKNTGWRQGFLTLWIFLWFLILPFKVSIFAAVLSFIFPLIFIYELFGGLGAYPLHPVLGGVLILHLFFQQEPMNGILESGHFLIWNCGSLLLLAFGGICLGLQKKIRILPAFSFILLAVLLNLILGRSLDLESFHILFILGFYILTDTTVSPLKAGAHLFLALGASICMVVLMMLGSGDLIAGVLSLTVWNLSSQGFDSLNFVRNGLNGAKHV